MGYENAEEINQTLRDIENAFDIYITVHDLCGLLRSESGKYLLEDRNVHPAPLCQRKEIFPYANDRCCKHCQYEVEQRALQELKPFHSTCYKGICEVIVPVLNRGMLKLLLYGGAFRNPQHRGPAPEFFDQQVIRLWEQLPVLDRETEAKISRILKITGRGILQWAEVECPFDQSESSRHNLIKRFIFENAHLPVTINDLAQALHLSTGRAGHILAEMFSKGFPELINQERLRRATSMLVTTAYTASEISRRCGFTNPYYFSRLFRKEIGCPPLQYRRKNVSRETADGSSDNPA